MRVLHLETGRHLYGGARQAGYLIDGLSRLGCENLLVCEPGQALAGRVNGAEIVAMHCGGDADFLWYRRLRRLIRQWSPDIVHVHSRRGADIFGGRAARAEGVAAILTRRVESREPGFWIRRKAAPYAAVVAISTAILSELQRARIAEPRLRRIPSAVDGALFCPDPGARVRLVERYGLPPDACIAGCAAQLIARKGQASLLPLAAAARAAEPRFRLLLFGQGPLRARLERRIRGSGLTGTVIVCGYADDWPVLLPGLDLLLHPAMREGLGAVVLEAMSAGVPVVAAAAGGLVDTIADGIDGRLVPPGADEAWEAAVLGLLGDPAARSALAAAARRKLERRFTIAQMAARYLEVYRNVLA